MTPEQLKASILQYAIQGKLVEQRPEEGTGEELYQQMQTDKQTLIREKKIKKEKPLPDIIDDEIPFDVPESWKWVKVGNVGSWSSGATPSRTNPAYYGGSIPWLKTGDLNDGFIQEVPEYITDLALEKTSLRLNPIGSVLMAMYGATIGKLGILEIPVTTNQACCACIPYAGMNNKYLFYYLMSMRQSYIGMAEGGAQPNISKEKIVNSLIPLPPAEEQRRIVAKIEELLPYVDRYAAAYEKLEQFNAKFPEDMKKSVLQYAIQGKLVEQREEEGTGEELYQQIQTEKQRLIKEGKIKKEKPLAEIDMYPQYWTPGIGGIFMRYSYEYKKMCVELYRQGKWVETPEGVKEKNFRNMIQIWARTEESCGVEALRHKNQNKVWTAEEKYELVAKVLAGESNRTTAIAAGIDKGLLYSWVRCYKMKGYQGLVAQRQGRPAQGA